MSDVLVQRVQNAECEVPTMRRWREAESRARRMGLELSEANRPASIAVCGATWTDLWKAPHTGYPKATSRIIIRTKPSIRQSVAKSTFPAW